MAWQGVAGRNVGWDAAQGVGWGGHEMGWDGVGWNQQTHGRRMAGAWQTYGITRLHL